MWKTAKVVLGAAPVGIALVDRLGYVAKVEGVSMRPALNPDGTAVDYVLLSRWAARDYRLRRGEVVSLISPRDPSQLLIKRVLALEGDVVDTSGYSRRYVRVPEGHCWVEGDNGGHSLDSNSFGPVSLGLVTARASAIVWPPSRWQRLEPTALPARISVVPDFGS